MQLRCPPSLLTWLRSLPGILRVTLDLPQALELRSICLLLGLVLSEVGGEAGLGVGRPSHDALRLPEEVRHRERRPELLFESVDFVDAVGRKQSRLLGAE